MRTAHGIVVVVFALTGCTLGTSGGEGDDGGEDAGGVTAGSGGSDGTGGAGGDSGRDATLGLPDTSTPDAAGPLADAGPSNVDVGPVEPDTGPAEADAAAPADCEPGAILIRPCGLNDRGESRTECTPDGFLGERGPCDDPDVCIDASTQREPCDDEGSRGRRCDAGSWSAWGPCEARPVCEDGGGVPPLAPASKDCTTEAQVVSSPGPARRVTTTTGSAGASVHPCARRASPPGRTAYVDPSASARAATCSKARRRSRKPR